jgi:hypothetical protein
MSRTNTKKDIPPGLNRCALIAALPQSCHLLDV